VFLTPAVEEAKWSATGSGQFAVAKISPQTPTERDLCGLKSKYGLFEYERNPLLLPGTEPRFLSHYPFV